jgi:Holliday junction resolvase RusA-like endonuclease
MATKSPTDSITFFVPGLPQPGGSKRAFRIGNKTVVTDANPKAKGWKSQVIDAAREAMQGRPLMTEALSVTMTFYLPRPKGHYGSGKNAAKLKASAPQYPTTKPDALKLARSTEDALTGIVWRDDSQTAWLSLYKRYATDVGIGVSVTARELPDLNTVDEVLR